MWLTRLAIHRPLIVWITLAAIAMLGLRAYFRLPSELNPRADVPTIVVTAVYPGASPPEVETQVTKPLEESLGGVGGVKAITSTSQANFAALSIEFVVGTKLERAMTEVRGKIEAARGQLPPDAKPPTAAKLDMNARPILQIGLTCASLSLRDLRTLADAKIRPVVERVPGVVSAQIVGGKQREIEVLVDTRRLAPNRINLEDIVTSLKAAGRDVPGGSLSANGRETEVRVLGAFTTLEAIRNTPILSQAREQSLAQTALQTPVSPETPSAPPLTIGEVAQITDSHRAATSLTRVNGKEGVSLVVSRASDSNTVRVVEGVRATLEGLKSQLPADLETETLHDDGRTVRAALEDVDSSLVLGAILAMGVILLFLHNRRGTLIVSLAIPICMIGTFLVIDAAGFTLNQMTLLALSLSVGILVDDSIVVLESITRHLQRGESPKDAALNGRAEIGFADLTTTLVDVVVFVPIAFMGGIVGGFFREFGLTIATATLLSLLVSFTLTPMLAAKWYRKGETLVPTRGGFFVLEKLYQRLEAGYSRLIGRALRYRALVMLVALVLVISVIGFTVGKLGTDFIPGSDQSLISISLETPAGASLQKTDALTREIEATLDSSAQIKGDIAARVADVGEVVGGFGSLPQQGSQFAQINLFLREKKGLSLSAAGKRLRSDLSIADSIRPKIMEIALRNGARVTVAAVRNVQGAGAPVQIELRGNDEAALANFATTALARVKTIPGVRDPDISLRVGKPEVRAQIQPERAAALGVPTALAGALVRDTLTGNADFVFREHETDLPLRVIARPEDRSGIADLFLTTDRNGAPVTLGDLATVTETVQQNSIERTAGIRTLTLTAYLDENAPPDTGDKILAALHALPNPNNGITIYPAGDAETLSENIPYFVSAMGMAVLLVYFVMAGLFNRLGVPLVIMFALPMALAGAFAALYVTKESLSLVSGIGMLMLLGLMGAKRDSTARLHEHTA